MKSSPETFGKTDVAACSYGRGNTCNDVCCFLAPRSGTITSMSICIIPSGVTVRFTVYADKHGAATACLAQSGESGSSSGKDRVCASITSYITEITQYWFAFKFNGSFHYDAKHDDGATDQDFSHLTLYSLNLWDR